MLETQPLLSPRDVARTLGISVPTVYRRITAGDLDAVRVGPGGPLRIRVEAVERFLEPVYAVQA